MILVSPQTPGMAAAASSNWSDDSRYLAVPQWRFHLGLQVRQRMLVIDTLERRVHGSRPLGWFLQPRSFTGGILVVDVEPNRKRLKRIEIAVPRALNTFRRVEVEWPSNVPEAK